MDSSYGTLLTKKLKAAKITPWPKPWQNLRSTCETELVETFPIQVVCAWLGNSPMVAQKHYLQVTDDHFAKAVQNPVQQNAETPREESQGVHGNDTNVNELREFATSCIPLRGLPMGDEGLEPPTPSV